MNLATSNALHSSPVLPSPAGTWGEDKRTALVPSSNSKLSPSTKMMSSTQDHYQHRYQEFVNNENKDAFAKFRKLKLSNSILLSYGQDKKSPHLNQFVSNNDDDDYENRKTTTMRLMNEWLEKSSSTYSLNRTQNLLVCTNL